MKFNSTTLSKMLALAFLTYLLCFKLVSTTIPPGMVGVRFNNATGLFKKDLNPGWHWEVVGLQRVMTLPAHFLFLNFAGDEAMSIRTKDNNTVTLDVSVPYRIIPGRAHSIIDAGNHERSASGRYRFERFANDTTISVLRETLAQLKSQDFYNTDRRLDVANKALAFLNSQLAPLHLEASHILIRAAYFRGEYETQLAQIQLNEQQKLLDGAKQLVAEEKQKLDNYTQQTAALVAAKGQNWETKIANLERAYQVGFLKLDQTKSGEARTLLDGINEAQLAKYKETAASVLGLEISEIGEHHIFGVKNIQAETIEYEQRVKSEADGRSARLVAEGDAQVAKVNGAFERKLNALLGSPGGAAYVAFQAASTIKFSDTLTFRSSDGVPSLLRLKDFAQAFMGQK